MTLAKFDWEIPDHPVIPASVKPVLPAFRDRGYEESVHYRLRGKIAEQETDAHVELNYFWAIAAVPLCAMASALSVAAGASVIYSGHTPYVIPCAAAAVGFLHVATLAFISQRKLHKRIIRNF